MSKVTHRSKLTSSGVDCWSCSVGAIHIRSIESNSPGSKPAIPRSVSSGPCAVFWTFGGAFPYR
jgi:hypothetical protein